MKKSAKSWLLLSNVYECGNSRCNKTISTPFGLCRNCFHELLEDLECMTQSPSFFYRFYDFIATKIDRFMGNIEHIIDKRKVRRKK